MKRGLVRSTRSRLAVLAVLILAFVCPLHGATSASARPLPGVTFNGVDYVEARAFFARYGLQETWVEPNRRLRLESAWTRIELEMDKREILHNGLRIFLGEPVIFRNRTLHISRIDAERYFAPVLRPAGIAGEIPKLRTIAIDPGHGGRDTGTLNALLKLDEKNLTLDVAQRVKGLLELQGYRVVLTRTEDRFVELEERALIVKRAGADLFISIHFNAVANAPGVRGTETYIMTPRHHPSTQPERDRTMIPTEYPGNRHDHWNAVLGHHFHKELLSLPGTSDRGLKRARFKVLTLLDCPGVLIESGYLSNDAEARRIGTEVYRNDLAGAISAGIRAYAVQLETAGKR